MAPQTDPVLARMQPRWNAARTERNLNVTQERLSGRRRARPRWRAAIVLATLATGGAALAARFDLLPGGARTPVDRTTPGPERAQASITSKRVAAEPVAAEPVEAPPVARVLERPSARPAQATHTGPRATQEFARESAQESAEALMHAADNARRAGKAADAVPLLQRLLREHAADVRAPLAAFTLGRILLVQLRRPAEAAEAFALSRRLAPGGALAADALAREVEAWARAGDATRAARLGREYSTAYPRGQRLPAVRRWGGLD